MCCWLLAAADGMAGAVYSGQCGQWQTGTRPTGRLADGQTGRLAACCKQQAGPGASGSQWRSVAAQLSAEPGPARRRETCLACLAAATRHLNPTAAYIELYRISVNSVALMLNCGEASVSCWLRSACG